MKRQLAVLMAIWAARRCLLPGHDPQLEHGGGRAFLRCRACRLRTPGWRIGPRPMPPIETAADRVRARIAANAKVEAGGPEWTGVDWAGPEPARTVAAVYQRQGPDVVFVGTLDDAMAGLVGELSIDGRDEDVQLLLMPTDRRRH